MVTDRPRVAPTFLGLGSFREPSRNRLPNWSASRPMRRPGTSEPPQRVSVHQVEADLSEACLQLIDVPPITDLDSCLLARQGKERDFADLRHAGQTLAGAH